MVVIDVTWYEAMGCDSTDTECYTRWEQVHIAAIPVSYISLCCSIYIIVMTLIYMKQFSKITFGATLPMYISICDAVFHSCHGTDHVHNLITGYISPDGWCLFLGAAKAWSINGQTCWAIATAIFINYCVRYGHPPSKYYKWFNLILHTICWGIPTLIIIFGFAFNTFGIEGPWCGITAKLDDFLMVDLWILVADMILIILYSWTCYTIYYKMKLANIHIRKVSANLDINSDNKSGTDNNKDNINKNAVNAAAQKSARSVRKVMRTLIWFPVVFVAQWTLFLSWKLFLAQTWPQTMAVVVVTNMGGMFNMIVFYRLLMNPVNKEKKKLKKQMEKQTQNKQNNIEMTEITVTGTGTTCTTTSNEHTVTSPSVMTVQSQSVASSQQ